MRVLILLLALAGATIVLFVVTYPGGQPACLPAGDGHPPSSIRQCQAYSTPSP
jgi:hypothetical protein